MRRVSRSAIPIVVLLALMPAAAQSHSSSGRPVEGAATCLGKSATFEASPGNHLVVGTPRADVLVGTRGTDQIRGRGGNDLICGGGGSDLLDGGPGRDRLSGGSGDDLVLGGTGEDRLSGGSGDDHLDGDASRDWCSGDGGANTYVSCEVIPSEHPPVVDHPPAPSSPGMVDHPPSAVNDTFVIDENAAATSIDVLANDTDVEGGPKTIESATEPHHGKVVIAVDGAGLTYEPADGYCNDGEADDTFTYVLNGESVGTVTVEVRCVTTVATDPTLTPPFDSAISDYTTRCTGQPLEVSGRMAAGATVVVDGDEPAGGKFESTVPLEENQAFRFTTTAEGESKTYTVRCLPSGFPEWDFEGFRPPSHELYVVAPNLISPLVPYAVIFDHDGVPVWWDTEPGGTLQDAKMLSDGSLAWWNATDGYVIRELDGALVQHVTAVGGDTDGHELQQLPSGNFLLISSETREDVNLTEFGGAAHENVLGNVVEEVSPSGELLWKWSTNGHIGLAETGRWWPTALATPEPRDIIHMNAVEPAGDGAVLISVRHTDAVYKIDKASGEIVWKLGGTWTPKSLQVLNDPEGAYPFGGQHDVRLLPDGTITIHDNNTGLGSPPRAVRYAIDEASRTATLVEQVADPLVSNSFCCGSARRSADGSWLISWGGNSAVTEYDATEQPNFRLSFGGSLFSYRAVPVADGVASVSSLRAGMDAMHPR